MEKEESSTRFLLKLLAEKGSLEQRIIYARITENGLWNKEPTGM
jgi:hypothetical protein